MPNDRSETTEPSEWWKWQNTPIQIPLSLAYTLWDFCCAKGKDEDAKHLMDAIEAVIPGYFANAE